MIRRVLPSLDARFRWMVVVLVVAFMAALPALANLSEQLNPDTSGRFEIYLGTSALVLALWAVSYNLMLGYGGMVSFAHAAYYGVGAYTVALLFGHSVPVLWGLLLTPFVAGAVGFLTGLVALRAVRLYFALLTLAISQVLFSLAFSLYNVTGGDNGVHGLTVPDAISDYTPMYYFVGAVVAVCLVLMFIIVRSPFGASLLAIRENRERARSIGINVKAHELAVFTIAAAFAGVAGGLYAVFQQEAYPEMLYWTQNAQPVVVVLIGGQGAFLGPAVGAIVYTVLNNLISTRFPYQFDIILGAVVLAIVLIAPGGFASLPEIFLRVRNRIRNQKPEAEPESAGSAIDDIDLTRAVDIEAVQAEPLELETGAPLLTVSGLSKAFGGLRAVIDVNLTVKAGDRHAIIGPNGAGKSTLFNLITGRIRPDQGRVLFGGTDITGKPPHVIARAGIGRAFQITTIFPKLSVLQNLQYAMLAHRGLTTRMWGVANRMFRDEAMTLLEAVGLGRVADLPAGQLSHGDQRAIEIAISLALGSRLVLLDEPTAGMSAYETQKAMELVRRIATENKLTLLFCEHDMSVVFGSARTVTVMHLGQVLTEGTPEQVRNDPQVQKIYLGELEDTA